MHDEWAIQQLINRYTDGCNRRDFDQLVATFAADGVWDAMGIRLQGHAAIRPGLSAFLERMSYFVQLNAPALISVDSDSGTARSAIRESGRFRGRLEALEVVGWYEDQLIRTADGWRFARRCWHGLGAHRYAILPGSPLE